MLLTHYYQHNKLVQEKATNVAHPLLPTPQMGQRMQLMLLQTPQTGAEKATNVAHPLLPTPQTGQS